MIEDYVLREKAKIRGAIKNFGCQQQRHVTNSIIAMNHQPDPISVHNKICKTDQNKGKIKIRVVDFCYCFCYIDHMNMCTDINCVQK